VKTYEKSDIIEKIANFKK